MTAARRVVRAHGVRESEEPNLIALRDRDVAEDERGVDGMVDLRQPTERAGHHSPGIEQDEDALLPLGLVLDAHRAAAARGRRPRDRAGVVVGLVLAQAFEQRARAGDARATLTRVIREPAPEAHLIAADLLEVRIHIRGGVRRNAALPLQQVERAAQADVHVSETEAAAMPRPRGVCGLRRETRTDDKL